MRAYYFFYFIKTVNETKRNCRFSIRWSWYNISRMYNTKAHEFGGTMSIGYALLNIDIGGTIN